MPVSNYRDVGDLFRMLLALQAANLLLDFLREIFRDLIEFFHLDLIGKIILPCRKFFYVNRDRHFRKALVRLEIVVLVIKNDWQSLMVCKKTMVFS